MISARSVDAVEAAGMGRVNRGFGSDNELKKGVTAWRRAFRCHQVKDYGSETDWSGYQWGQRAFQWTGEDQRCAGLSCKILSVVGKWEFQSLWKKHTTKYLRCVDIPGRQELPGAKAAPTNPQCDTKSVTPVAMASSLAWIHFEMKDGGKFFFVSVSRFSKTEDLKTKASLGISNRLSASAMT